MDLVAVLATVILMATVLTLVFAFASYFVSRAKRRLKKEKSNPDQTGAPTQRTYFERYVPEGGLEEKPQHNTKSGDENSQWI